MLRTALAATLTLVASLSAQESSSDGRAPDADRILQQRLRATAALSRMAFDVTWTSERNVRMGARRPSKPVTQRGRIDGSMIYSVVPSLDREVLQVGRTSLVRMDGEDWRITMIGRGTAGVAAVRDPVPALLALASNAPKVARRGIGELDGRAVETFSVVLDEPQVQALAWCGVIQDPMMIARSLAARGLEVPEASVDLAVHCDVESGHVRRVEVRTISDYVNMNALRGVGARGGRRGGEADPADPAEAATEASKQPAKPLKYHGGLPVRTTEGRCVNTVMWNLKDHGRAPRIELDELQKRLLGR